VMTAIATDLPPGPGTEMRRTPSVKPSPANAARAFSTSRCRAHLPLLAPPNKAITAKIAHQQERPRRSTAALSTFAAGIE
jgi:hypothetical protein